MTTPTFPKPGEFRLSREQTAALAEFKRAITEAGEAVNRRMASAVAEINASTERMRQEQAAKRKSAT